MSKLQPVRGTKDILPAEMNTHSYIETVGEDFAGRFGYARVATPIFEFTKVFARTLGDTSDIVTKEMYTFEDKGGDSLTLRPEGTAGIARAFITEGLKQEVPVKFFYSGPMFRHERPQKGRMRQFHQIGVELIGVETPTADVEVIALAAAILGELGVLEDTDLHLNTLGDGDSRQAYLAALLDYLKDHANALSPDSQTRLERNPLRILDSKADEDREIVAAAPTITDYLSSPARDFFAALCQGLDDLEIAYQLNPKLVRGLDYYCHTAFEFITDKLGSQGTVLAGGRYDGLIEMLGGAPTPGIGWAAGIERLSMLLDDVPAPPRPIAIIPLGHAAERMAAKLANQLRLAGFIIELAYRGNLTRRLKRANKLGACAAVIIGDDELADGAATLRDLDSGAQSTAPLDGLASRLVSFQAPR
ncbi:MAG: histidine--tRNA ligase [Alphaproteobacteria bacterium]|nr:histidine--tRNA ligase [Alphaproteobacteria bacterium]MCZ6764569.1 histidine--tRNA ligase [Alphaproteobacteria bacterium]